MLINIKLLVIVSVGLIVVCTAASIWIPSVTQATSALREAREDQLIGTAKSVSKNALEYFTRASSSASSFVSMYNTSYTRAPGDAPRDFLSSYGPAVWAMLANEPTLASLLVAHLRDPTHVATQTGNNSHCDVDATLISTTYVSTMRYDTSGVTVPNCEQLQDASCPGYARMVNIDGAANIGDPLARKKIMFDKPCTTWLGHSDNLWNMQGLPGNRSADDTGLGSGLEWFQTIVIVGKAPKDALYKKVYFKVPGPWWAPDSAFGALSQRVGDSTLGAGAQSVQDALVSAAASTDVNDVIFLLTASRELLASSIAGQKTEVRYGHSGALIGLTKADNTSVVDPAIVSVASVIFGTHCTETRCSWVDIPAGTLTVNGYTTVMLDVQDSYARGLDLLLVVMVKESTVLQPATDLLVFITIMACVVIAVFCCAAVVFAHFLTKPIQSVAGAFDCIAVMDMSGAGVRAVPLESRIDELDSLYKGFWSTMMMVEKVQSFAPVIEREVDTEMELSDSTSRSGATSLLTRDAAFSALNLGVRMLGTGRMATCMVVSCQMFEGLFDNNLLGQYTDFFVALYEATKEHLGQIVQLCGTRAVLTWSTTKSLQCGGSIHALALAEEIQGPIRRGMKEESFISVGLHKTQTYFGVLGSKSQRFHVVGSELQDVAMALCLLNHEIDLGITVSLKVSEAGSNAICYEVFRVRVRGVGLVSVYWVAKFKEVEGAEWMYQLQEVSNAKVTFLSDFFNTLAADELTKFDANHPEHKALSMRLRAELSEGRLTEETMQN